jgi:hypothetical protein
MVDVVILFLLLLHYKEGLEREMEDEGGERRRRRLCKFICIWRVMSENERKNEEREGMGSTKHTPK